jgi:hypothetical protein
MAKLKQILTGNKARLEVDLEEMFGVDVPNDSKFRQAVGQAIIDKIRDRTEDGVSRTGSSFKKYSDAYADSIDFKAYGKSKDEPNLKQTGEMLGFLDIIEETQNKIVLGWNDDNASKAHGHITGNVGVKRDFLGLPDNELNSIAEDFQDFLGERFANSPEVTKPSVNSSVQRLRDVIAGERNLSSNTTLSNIIRGLFSDGES